jgi:VWFA-related protein
MSFPPIQTNKLWLPSVLFCLALAFGFIAVPLDSTAEKDQRQPRPGNGENTLRTTSSLVTVDVVVTRNGQPVSGLSQEMFHVFEDGREQIIKYFEEHEAASQPSTYKEAEHKKDALPHSVYSNEISGNEVVNILLLDGLNTLVSDQVYVRKQMVEQAKSIPAGTRIGIFTLGAQLRMVQDITSDVSVISAAFQSSKNTPNPSALLEQPDDSQPSEIPGNDGASDALQNFQTEHSAQETDLRVRLTLDAMQQLVKYLSAVPGRKNVLWLSGSFPVSLDPDTSNNPFLGQRTYSEELHQISNEMAAARMAVYPIDVRGVLPQAIFSASNAGSNYASGMRARTGRRTGGGGPAAFTRDLAQISSDIAAEHASMQQIATDTGGYAFYSGNDLKHAIAAALQDGANYYTLSYVPPNKKTDGKFRRISVKIPTDNYQLAYRHGYFATAPEIHTAEDSNALLKPDAPAIQHGAPLASQILFKARVLSGDASAAKQPPAGLLASRLKGPVQQYAIDYNIDLHGVNISSTSDQMFHAALEVIAVVYDKNGRIVNVVDQPFRLNMQSADYEKVSRMGLTLHQEIAGPEAQTYLRLAVHDLITNRLGSLEVSLDRATQIN